MANHGPQIDTGGNNFAIIYIFPIGGHRWSEEKALSQKFCLNFQGTTFRLL